MAVRYAEEGNYKELINGDSSFKVLVFSAEWCGPCQMYHPVLDEYAVQYSHTNIIDIDIDKLPEVAAEYNVTSVPTTILLENGKELAREVGVMPVDVLDDFINENLAGSSCACGGSCSCNS